jgi:uncharacterized protein (DUF305 family)
LLKTKEAIKNSKVEEIENFKKTIIKMDEEIKKMKKLFKDLKVIDKQFTLFKILL